MTAPDLTGRAQRVLALARQEARDLRLPTVNIETLLLALVQDDPDGLAVSAVVADGQPPDAAVARMRATLAPDGLPDLGPDAFAALGEAARLAEASEAGYLGVEHVLLGVLADATERGDAAQGLLSRTVHTDRAMVRDRLLVALAERDGKQDRRLIDLLAGEGRAAKPVRPGAAEPPRPRPGIPTNPNQGGNYDQ